MSDKTYSKNAKTTTYTFNGSMAGLTTREFVAIANGDTTTKDPIAVFSFLSRAMRAQLRAEGDANATLWSVVPDSVRAEVKTVRYEISDAEFMRIGTLCATRAEGAQFDMTRTISAGSAVLAWELANASGMCEVSAPCDPREMVPADYLKWYSGAVSSARKQVTRALVREFGMPEGDAKKASKLVGFACAEFKAGKSGLYGVNFADLAPYEVPAEDSDKNA